MLPTLITADWHLNDNPRDNYRHAFVEKLPKIIEKYKVDLLIILGDLTHAKDRHGAWLVNTVVSRHIKALRNVCDVIIVRGNHDYLNVENPFFSFLQDMNITWVNRPYKYRDWLFLPHTLNYKHDWGDLPFDLYPFIFAHATFTGATLGDGRKLQGIPLEVIPKGVRVISGDIHIPQTIGPVTYVGAPYLVDFGDDYEPRLLLLHDDKVTSLRLTGPQKRLINVVVDNSGWHREGSEPNKGDIVKVRVHLPPEKSAHWYEIRNEIRDWCNKHDYQLYSVQFSSDTVVGTKVTSIQHNKSDEQLLREFANNRGLDPTTLQAGMNLMKTTTTEGNKTA